MKERRGRAERIKARDAQKRGLSGFFLAGKRRAEEEVGLAWKRRERIQEGGTGEKEVGIAKTSGKGKECL